MAGITVILAMEFSDRLKLFHTGIFADLKDKQNEVIAKGGSVINVSVGTPDFEPFPHVKKAFLDAANEPGNFGYSLRDLPELTGAVVEYYRKRFDVEITEDMVTSVNGSQEGIGHIGMALCNPEDVVLCPNPGYPIFEAGSLLAGADIYYYPLLEENGFLPDFDSIPEDVARKAKYIIMSYPMNPVCVTAPPRVYDDLIAFAKKYDIIVIHDNAYSDIIYDGRYGDSFLHHEGAADVGVEFFSLSKTFNLTGARISFCVGNRKIVDALKMLRSQIDFGVFIPTQKAAIAALTGPLEPVKEQCLKYQERRDALCQGLRNIGWDVPDCEGTMFMWAPIPPKFKTSQEFCMELIDKTGIFVTPGTAFGTLGEGYVRFALTKTVEEFEEIIKIIGDSGVLK